MRSLDWPWSQQGDKTAAGGWLLEVVRGVHVETYDQRTHITKMIQKYSQ